MYLEYEKQILSEIRKISNNDRIKRKDFQTVIKKFNLNLSEGKKIPITNGYFDRFKKRVLKLQKKEEELSEVISNSSYEKPSNDESPYISDSNSEIQENWCLKQLPILVGYQDQDF